MATCPEGHTTASTDYCDTCGMPVGAQAVPGPGAAAAPGPDAAGIPQPGAAAQHQPCPNCAALNPTDALFCEACGYDYTTGTMPRSGAEAADLLSIDTPVRPQASAPASPAAPAAPAATPSVLDPGTPRVPSPAPGDDRLEAEIPEVHAPAADAPAASAGAPDVGAPGETPATEKEAHDIASAEGMPEEGATPPAAVSEGTLAPTGSQPDAAPAGAAPVEWVAEVWVDPDWYAVQQSSERMPSPGLPDVVPLRGRHQLIGRVSQSRNIHPDVDCGADSGVSRRQAQLSTDGQRWFVEDLDSANGTYVGATGQPLPEDPIDGRRELADDDRLYVGAWTRIVLRRATPDERAAFGG